MQKTISILPQKWVLAKGESFLLVDPIKESIKKEFGLAGDDIKILMAKDNNPVNIASTTDIPLQTVEQNIQNILLRLNADNLRKARMKILKKITKELLLTVGEAGNLLHLHKNTVRRYGDNGILSLVISGPRRDRRFLKEEIQFLMEEDLKEIYQQNRDQVKNSSGNGLLTIERVADILEISTCLVRKWSDKGFLHPIRIGPRGDRRFNSQEIELIKKFGLKLMKVADVKKAFGVNANTIIRWSERGILHPIRVGPRKDRRFDPEEIKLLKGLKENSIAAGQVVQTSIVHSFIIKQWIRKNSVPLSRAEKKSGVDGAIHRRHTTLISEKTREIKVETRKVVSQEGERVSTSAETVVFKNNQTGTNLLAADFHPGDSAKDNNPRSAVYGREGIVSKVNDNETIVDFGEEGKIKRVYVRGINLLDLIPIEKTGR